MLGNGKHASMRCFSGPAIHGRPFAGAPHAARKPGSPTLVDQDLDPVAVQRATEALALVLGLPQQPTVEIVDSDRGKAGRAEVGKCDRDGNPADPWKPRREPLLSRKSNDHLFYGLNSAMARFDETQLRSLIDLQDAYEATLALWREVDRHAGRMTWKTIAGRDYLYHVHGDAGLGRSLGPRSPENERRYDEFRHGKQLTKAQLAATEPDMRRAAAVYVAVGLPVADSWAAKLFQHLDRERLMGKSVLVVGTNAMPAYQVEAQERMAARIHATRDTDLAWCAREDSDDAVLWPALREFDPTFRINAERPFQAIGKGSRELELLAAPSILHGLEAEPFRPVTNLEEQEWLLLGSPLRQVVCSLDRTPCGMVVPDPRFFALHKAWLAKKPDRDPRKAPKDARQAALVWAWLANMPRYPVDAEFLASVPSALKGTLSELTAASSEKA